MVFLLCLCIESLFEKIPQEPNIVAFLESNDEEEVNGEEYVKRLLCCHGVLYSYVQFLFLYYAYIMLIIVFVLMISPYLEQGSGVPSTTYLWALSIA